VVAEAGWSVRNSDWLKKKAKEQQQKKRREKPGYNYWNIDL